MGAVGMVLLFMVTYIIGVLAGCFYSFGSRAMWKKGVIWKNRYREYLSETRMKHMAETMHGLADAFRDSGTSSYERMNREMAATALADTFSQVCQPCGGCHMGKLPWQKDSFYLQYLMNSFSRNGRIESQDMPRIFSETCCDVSRYIEGLNEGLEKNRLSVDWKSRYLESRDVVVSQFREMEKMLRGWSAAGELRRDVTEQWEKRIRSECRKLKLKAGRCYVEERENGSLQIHLMVQSAGKHAVPVRELTDAVDKVIKKKFRIEEKSRTMIGKEACRIVLEEEPPLGVCYGVARAVGGGGDVSGDNFSAMEMSEGRYLVCLSDGMGSGRGAASESEAVVELAEQMMEAGFSVDTAARAINSVRLLCQGEQHPATLDLHCLDLYSGKMISRKHGAAVTLIKHGENVTMLESEEAPVGWSQELAGDEMVRQLEKDSFVVFMTDGVVEALPGQEKEEFLVEILRRIKGENPQTMAEDILGLAMGAEVPRDDMLVLVVGVRGR